MFYPHSVIGKVYVFGGIGQNYGIFYRTGIRIR